MCRPFTFRPFFRRPKLSDVRAWQSNNASIGVHVDNFAVDAVIVNCLLVVDHANVVTPETTETIIMAIKKLTCYVNTKIFFDNI